MRSLSQSLLRVFARGRVGAFPAASPFSRPPSPPSAQGVTLRASNHQQIFVLQQFHAGPGVGQGKDFTLYALRDGEVLFKIGANKKQFVRVVDAVDRSGREDGKPTRREKKLKLYTPRAQLRAEAEAVAASSR